MKTTFFLFVLPQSLVLSLCSQTENQVKRIDSLVLAGAPQQISLPYMDHCGGGVVGYFQDTNLIFIDATYNGELGNTSQKVYWSGEDIVQVIYHAHHADWEKFEKDFPQDEVKYDFEFETNNMTYIDETFYITYSTNNYTVQEFDGGTLIDINEEGDNLETFNSLKSCGWSMRSNLEKEFHSKE